MYCTQCGKANPADAKFCAHCGAAQTSAHGAAAPAPLPRRTESAAQVAPADPVATKMRLAGYEKVEELVCAHCGTKGPKGVDSVLRSNGLAPVIGIVLLGGGITVVVVAGKMMSNPAPLVFLTVALARLAYAANKIKKAHCEHCGEDFFVDKKGETSKTKP